MRVQPIWAILLPAAALLVATGLWAVRRWPRATTPARMLAILRLLLALTAVAIGVHPVGTVRVSVPREAPTDVVVLLDRTTSMGALDFDGERPRMTGAVRDLTRLVEDLAGARIAVIVFDDDARLAVPFTTDATSVASFLQTVGWRPSSKASGSDVSVALDLAGQTLRRARADRPDHARYLVYAGDGEQTADRAPESFEPLRGAVTSSIVLGYGTEAGAPMRASVEGEELVRLDGRVQTSRVDEDVLRAIADQLGGSYHHRTRPGDLPDAAMATPATVTTELRPGREYYWILAVAAGLGLCVLVWPTASALREVKEEVADARR